MFARLGVGLFAVLVCAACSTGAAGVQHGGMAAQGPTSSASTMVPPRPTDTGVLGAGIWVPPQSCTIYRSGSDLRIEVDDAGNSESDCASLAKTLSVGGEYWTKLAQAPAATLTLVCAMQSESAVVVKVVDDQSDARGRTICSSLLSNGWQEDTSAE